MQPTMIIPAATVTPRAPRLSSIRPTHTEEMPPSPDPSAKPMLMDVADQPNSSCMGRTNTPTMGPCIGTLAAAFSMLAVMMAQP